MIMFIVKGRHQIRGKRWSNVWNFPRINSAKLRMPAEKPIGIYERAIEASSDPGDLIIDTFGGSGTAAEAAINTGRRFLVCDVDKKMVKMSRKRVGLPVIDDDTQSRTMSVCPIFNVVPPDPSLWGVHPEDLEHFGITR
ncbi:unnamed protein product [Sphagnum tenellum]